MKFILQPNEGERVTLGAPLCGEILVKTDPAIVGGQMVMVVQTLPPGGVIAVHRYLQHPLFIWVAKGQGRVTVESHQHTVVPGNAVVVPTGQWYGLRNTGTGLFQIVWVAPASLVSFYRSVGQAAQPLEASALQSLAEPFGIEFQPAGAVAVQQHVSRPRHPRRRFHRPDRKERPQAAQPPPAPQPIAELTLAPVPIVNEPEVIQPVSMPPVEVKPAQGRPDPNRRHRNRSRRHGPPRTALPQSESGAAKTEVPSAEPTTTASTPSSTRPPSRRQPGRNRPSGRYGHTKEVFMGGRWVKVSGEGPIIASGD